MFEILCYLVTFCNILFFQYIEIIEVIYASNMRRFAENREWKPREPVTGPTGWRSTVVSTSAGTLIVFVIQDRRVITL